MQFLHQSLTWGFLLALAPLLIHLINLVRRRRVQWAAMDFLLKSYKKHRTWVWLKQLLLLLARMAVICLIVAMLAQWVTQKQWFALLGNTSTHHYLLLDDSYSMSEHRGGATAMDRAKEALGQIANQAMAQETRQKLTLLRFSKAAAESDAEAMAGGIADFNGEIVDANFDVLLEEKRRLIDPTELAVGPMRALQVIEQLIEPDNDETEVVYLVSDFREKDWSNPREIRQLLEAVSRAGAEIHFISCAEEPQQNLAIVGVEPASDTRAAGVPLFVNIRVKNFGRTPALKVPVGVRTLFYDPQAASSADPGELSPKSDEPPAVLIEEIPPGQVASVRTQVFFPQPGPHVVEATLPEDPVAADNRRRCVVELAESEPVLVIDDSPTQKRGYFLEAAFNPGERTQTGIRPEVKTSAFLRDTTAKALQEFRAIYLLDVDRLDERALENLEDFVRDGGGLAVFTGEQASVPFYNERFYKDGQGLFPLPLDRDALLSEERMENSPDFEVMEHPIFSVFLGEENPLIRLVTIERYFQPPKDWSAQMQSDARVIARLRNGDPLAVERRFGEGRVVAFLTTAAPDWNNWARDPTFVVVMLKLQAYLSAPFYQDQERLVGSPLDVQLDASGFRKNLAFVVPGETRDRPLVIERIAEKPQSDSPVRIASLGRPDQGGSASETYRSGIYEAWAPSVSGPFEIRRFALNVDPEEGDLEVAAPQTLSARLDPVEVRFRRADQIAYDPVRQAGANRSLLLMGLLIALLLGEQWLAYSTSYHPRSGVVRG